ncbi:MAG: SH3 domain-containing protein [Anaerolineales bacterium]|nr:MAG: SH3 domain-containing protein [Anaerolineales bacterium]
MFAKKIKTVLSVLLVALAVLACNLPGGAPPTETPTVEDTATPTASETPTPIVEACTPKVTANTVANVRNGPGQVYAIIGSLPLGGTATVAGKNYDGTWWYIDFSGGEGGHAWIAASVTTADCIPSTLASIAAPPTPVVPTALPSNTVVAVAPSVTSTPLIFIFPLPLFPINSPTPTPIFLFPVFPFP